MDTPGAFSAESLVIARCAVKFQGRNFNVCCSGLVVGL